MPSYRGKPLEYLLSMLESTQTLEERLALLEALGKFRNKRAAQPLIEALGDENPSIRTWALYSLARMRNKHAFEPLLARLNDNPSTNETIHLVSNLGRLRDKRAIELLARLLNHPDKTVRVLTINALGQIKDEKVMPYLLQALGSETTRVWEAAEMVLRRLGQSAVKSLIDALKSENPRLRDKAASTLVYFHDLEAVEPLIEALKDSVPEVRASVASALGELEDERAVEPLIEALKDNAPEVRASVANALGELEDERAVEPLIASLSDPDEGVRRNLIASLGAFGAKAKMALKPLMEMASDKTNSSAIRSGAVRAIGRIDATNPLIYNPLIEAFNEADFKLRLAAAGVLGKHDSSFIPAIDFLLDALSNPDWLNQCHAIDDLAEIPAVIERSIGPLTKALSDEYHIIRRNAALALGDLGDIRALPALEQVRQRDKQSSVAKEAEEAIARIEQISKPTAD